MAIGKVQQVKRDHNIQVQMGKRRQNGAVLSNWPALRKVKIKGTYPPQVNNAV